MSLNLNSWLEKNKFFSKASLEKLAEDAAKQNLPLWQYLEKNNLLEPDKLLDFWHEAFNYPKVETISDKMTDQQLLSKISFKFLRDNYLIPATIGDQLYIITSNPFDVRPIEELRMFLQLPLPIAVSTKAVIIDSINRYYPLEGTKEMIDELGEEDELKDALTFEDLKEEDILGMAQEAPIIKLVNQILYQAVKKNASDIHIEPFEKDILVRYRIDGIMQQILTPPKRIQNALISRIKIMANLNIAEKRVPQDGRIQIKVGDRAIDIRVSVLPVRFGENIVMRLLDKSKTFGQLNNLGMSEHDLAVLERCISQPNGIILMSGPTGSGKTSTLYSILSKLNRPEVTIITVEDPVEYQMLGVVQVQVNEKVGLTFANALRSILRQDPDIIMIGETRDEETAQIAIQSSLTGHLVLSTIHTNSAPSTVTRLIDMGIEPFLIASTLSCVVAQRLVRKLCPLCKELYNPNIEILKRLGITAGQALEIKFYKPKGCPECSSTGYRGRIAIFEVMPMTQNIANLTVERADANKIRAVAIKEGMKLLVQDGIEKIKKGLTTVDEVLSVATNIEGFE
jgi:general secretion pathway protein E